MSELLPKSTPAQRAEHERLARATTIAPTPGATPQRFATDDEYYAALDQADANHAERMRAVRAAASAVSAPAPTPAPAVARPTPTPPQIPTYAMNVPTISQPNGTPEPVDGNIRFMPATGRGAVANSADDTLIAYTADRSETAQATSHVMRDDGREIAPEFAQLKANVEAAQKRLAENTDPSKRAAFEGQVSRAHETLVHYASRLEELAKLRGSK